MLISIRDCRHSIKDRQWIQSVYGEYIDSLADLNTGLFSVIGADNPREDEIFANWFSNDHSHPLLILKGPEPVGFALVTRPRIPAAGEPAADAAASAAADSAAAASAAAEAASSAASAAKQP